MIPPPNRAIAWPWRSGGLMSNIVACASGTRKAPLTPWMIRNNTISGKEVAIAHSMEAMVKPTTEISISRLRPTRSDNQPAIGIAIAVATM